MTSFVTRLGFLNIIVLFKQLSLQIVKAGEDRITCLSKLGVKSTSSTVITAAAAANIFKLSHSLISQVDQSKLISEGWSTD